MKSNPFEVKKRHSKALLKMPNVVGLAVGPKSIKGVLTDTMAIKIYVKKKMPREVLSRDACVPMKIDGIPTDVEEREGSENGLNSLLSHG